LHWLIGSGPDYIVDCTADVLSPGDKERTLRRFLKSGLDALGKPAVKWCSKDFFKSIFLPQLLGEIRWIYKSRSRFWWGDTVLDTYTKRCAKSDWIVEAM